MSRVHEAMLDTVDSGVVPRKGDIPVSLCVWAGKSVCVWAGGTYNT